MSNRKFGPKMHRLAAVCAAREAFPKGGSFADGMAVLSSVEDIQEVTRQALALADELILIYREALDTSYEDDEETIAGAILDVLNTRKKDRR